MGGDKMMTKIQTIEAQTEHKSERPHPFLLLSILSSRVATKNHVKNTIFYNLITMYDLGMTGG
jgi:hypothetical protein